MSKTVEVVKGCHECRFYRVLNEVKEARCLAPGKRPGNYAMPLHTAPPYKGDLTAPELCPLRVGAIEVHYEVRLEE